jgi:hypothetical protein
MKKHKKIKPQRRYSLGRLVVAVLVVALVGYIGVRIEQGSHAANLYSWSPSAISGGGYQNTLAISPFADSNGDHPMVVGMDVAGLARSVDGGAHWQNTMLGMASQAGGAKHVSSVYWSPATRGKVYAATDRLICFDGLGCNVERCSGSQRRRLAE